MSTFWGLMSVMLNQECSLKVVKKHSDIQNVTHVTHHKNIHSDISDNVTVCHTVKNSVTKSDIFISDFIKKYSLNVTLFSFKNNLKGYKKHSDILSDMSRFVTAENYNNIISKPVTIYDILKSENTIEKMTMSLFVKVRQKWMTFTPIYIDIYRGYKDPPNISIYMNGKKLGRQTQKNSEKKFAEKIKNSVCKNFSLMITCGGHHAV